MSRYAVFTFIAAPQRANPTWCLFIRNSGFTKNFHSPLESTWVATNLPWGISKLSVCTVKIFFVVAAYHHQRFSLDLMKSLLDGQMLYSVYLNTGCRKTFWNVLTCFWSSNDIGLLFVFASSAGVVIVARKVAFKSTITEFRRKSMHSKREGVEWYWKWSCISLGHQTTLSLPRICCSVLLCFEQETLHIEQLRNIQQLALTKLPDKLRSGKLHVTLGSGAKLGVGGLYS